MTGRGLRERGAARWLAGRWERLNGPARLGGVDLARGLAVIGMLAAHLLADAEASPLQLVPGESFADGRSSILFATLAGVSIGLVTGGAAPFGRDALGRARRRLSARAVLLMAIGLLLIATGVPVYVILPAYAILFLLALPFAGIGARGLFAVAAAIGLVMPFVQPLLDGLPVWDEPYGPDLALVLGWHYPFPVWLAFVLAGMGVARIDLRRASTAWRLVAVGGALALAGYGLHRLSGAGDGTDDGVVVWTARAHSSGLLEVIGSGGFALAAIGACVLACRGPVALVVLPLRAVGAMPLTAYVAQLVVWALWSQEALGTTGDLAGFRALDPFWPITLGILLGCTAWALLVGRGPLEALTASVARIAAPPHP
ncbi:heparan-alpha-glucosaminide N-acetyltransferase domain-containing protein [Microbacterium sp. No. 7]|uniref:heparan-alpha-glucosaminide N-acetyltransferase domain-containing protein n=1 Tax=Microbacterium sp. No. 7 TaxID=1714373 RepID=UPI0006ECF0E4|nr:heparan-alpha-glucosaminide N-acetyltransferase domain-containing protein [Microbacterium sp. No. 7]ALJ20983.1 acyltransferase [Microbacterium sp. No. 7]